MDPHLQLMGLLGVDAPRRLPLVLPILAEHSMKVRTLLFAAAVSALGSSNLSAQAINHRATGLAAPTYTLDFNSLTYGSFPGVINDVDFGTEWSAEQPGCLGSTFTTGALFTFSCVASRPTPSPMTVNFTSAVNGAAFNLITNNSTTTFTAFLGSVQVSTFDAATSTNEPESYWYGFENTVLDRIVISEPFVNGAMVLDNMQVATNVVPEPSTYALMFSGLMALGFAAKRRRLV